MGYIAEDEAINQLDSWNKEYQLVNSDKIHPIMARQYPFFLLALMLLQLLMAVFLPLKVMLETKQARDHVSQHWFNQPHHHHDSTEHAHHHDDEGSFEHLALDEFSNNVYNITSDWVMPVISPSHPLFVLRLLSPPSRAPDSLFRPPRFNV